MCTEFYSFKQCFYLAYFKSNPGQRTLPMMRIPWCSQQNGVPSESSEVRTGQAALGQQRSNLYNEQGAASPSFPTTLIAPLRHKDTTQRT